MKETNATRVILQPQMLDKLKEAESLLDDIQEGLEWLFGKEKTILSKVNSPFHLSAVGVGVKYVYINTSKVHFFIIFQVFSLDAAMISQESFLRQRIHSMSNHT